MVELTSKFEEKTNMNMYPCGSCEYQSHQKSKIKRHVLYKHTPSANLECKDCKRIFKYVLTYNKHIKYENCTKNGKK